MAIIYCYTNKQNNKKYIGQTVDEKHRMQSHKNDAWNSNASDWGCPFHRAIRKYGWDNFDYEVLAQSEDEDAINLLEAFFIEKLDSRVPNGYNVQTGGKNKYRLQMSDETKDKLRWAHSDLTYEEIVFLRNAYKEKKSPNQIFKEKYEGKMHKQSFMNIWCGKRYSNIMPEVFAEKNRHTKINQDIANEIRLKRQETNLSFKALGEQYGISESTVADIINRRTWNHDLEKEPVSTILGTEE